MATSVSTIGPNTKTILVDNDTQAGVLSQISAILVASGWEIWDQVSTTNLVVRSKCYDGVNYKYVQISVPATTQLSVTAWESWNNSTHAGTNQAYYNGNTGACVLTISLTSCNITVFSSNRYAVFVVNGAANMSAACFEFYRDNPTDLPASGFPNFFMTTYQSLITNGGFPTGASYNSGQIGNNGYNTITVGGLPRNRYGDTGQKAAQANALISMCGLVGGAAAYAVNSSYSAVSPATPLVNGNTVQLLASTPILICSVSNFMNIIWGGTAGQFDWRGRVFGLKMLPYNFGQYGDITSLLCDSNGFTDVGGTAQDHFILGQIAIPL